MNDVYILLGSNIEKEQNIIKAVQLLRRFCKVVDTSSVYETSPIGPTEQPNYFNAAIHVKTDLSEISFKQQVLTLIEQKLNRVRTKDKNAPRTIDADIIIFDNKVRDFERHQIQNSERLIYPHIAVPIAEIAPALQHPELDQPMKIIAEKTMLAIRHGSGSNLSIQKRIDVVI